MWSFWNVCVPVSPYELLYNFVLSFGMKRPPHFKNYKAAVTHFLFKFFFLLILKNIFLVLSDYCFRNNNVTMANNFHLKKKHLFLLQVFEEEKELTEKKIRIDDLLKLENDFFRCSCINMLNKILYIFNTRIKWKKDKKDKKTLIILHWKYWKQWDECAKFVSFRKWGVSFFIGALSRRIKQTFSKWTSWWLAPQNENIEIQLIDEEKEVKKKRFLFLIILPVICLSQFG